MPPVNARVGGALWAVAAARGLPAGFGRSATDPRQHSYEIPGFSVHQFPLDVFQRFTIGFQQLLKPKSGG